MLKRILFVACLLGPSVVAAAWPEIPFPTGARIEAIGEQVRLNGIPMRMYRVLSGQRPKELIGFYRNVLGERHAESRAPGSHILSQARGNYFITVKVAPLSANLTEVLVSTSDTLEAKRAANRPLGFGLPADSVVLSDMESIDGGKRSRQLVVNNNHAVETNLQAFTRELGARGLRPDSQPLLKSESEYVQLFKGDKREAQLALIRKGGQTHIVLTTIYTP